MVPASFLRKTLWIQSRRRHSPAHHSLILTRMQTNKQCSHTHARCMPVPLPFPRHCSVRAFLSCSQVCCALPLPPVLVLAVGQAVLGSRINNRFTTSWRYCMHTPPESMPRNDSGFYINMFMRAPSTTSPQPDSAHPPAHIISSYSCPYNMCAPSASPCSCSALVHLGRASWSTMSRRLLGTCCGPHVPGT